MREQVRQAARDGWLEPSDLPVDPLARIAFWMERERLINAQVVAAIDAARDGGAKWWEIGSAMGRTGEAARAFRHYHSRDADEG